MANNQEPIRRNDVIRCEKCGEDYSVTYKRCPFCDERPNRSRRAEGGTVKTNSGRRVAGGAQGGYGRSVNPLQVAGVVGSLVLIIAALYIVFSVVSPLLGGGNPDVSQSKPSSSVSQSPSGSTSVEDPSTSGDISVPDVVEPVVIPANSIKLSEFDFTLRANQTHKIKATVDPSNATVVWSSSDESVAMVGQDGTVYNVNTGSGKKVVTITATSGDKTAECIVRCSGGSSGTNVPPEVTPGTPSTPVTPETPSTPSTPETPTTPETPSTGSGLAVGTSAKVSGAGSGLNVRTGPGSSYERIASLNNGSHVKILDNSDSSWYKISFSGNGGKTTEGYVSKDFIVAR